MFIDGTIVFNAFETNFDGKYIFEGLLMHLSGLQKESPGTEKQISLKKEK